MQCSFFIALCYYILFWRASRYDARVKFTQSLHFSFRVIDGSELAEISILAGRILGKIVYELYKTPLGGMCNFTNIFFILYILLIILRIYGIISFMIRYCRVFATCLREGVFSLLITHNPRLTNPGGLPNMKKRIIALLLCLVMTVSVFAGCAGSIDADSDYKGEQIMMYLTEDIYNLDPAYAYKNEATRSIVSLIFDTLFTVDSTGKVSPSLAKGYRTEEKEGRFFMYIEIKEDAKWSDNNPVTADDVAYAWKRVLNPKNSFEAAALLFDIKGAREYNLTGEGKDAMGISADQSLLTLEFEGKIDVDQFILNLTSLALAPLREDIVGELKDNDKQADDWAKKPSIMVASGPFKLTKVGYYTAAGVEYMDINYSDKKRILHVLVLL